MRRLKSFCFSVLVTGGLAVLSAGPLGETLRRTVERPELFGWRHRLSRDPQLDARLKIYAFDDHTLANRGRDDLTLEEWAAFLEALDPYHPRAVFIDKLFGTPRREKPPDAFVKRLRKLSYPVVIGAFSPPTPIFGRDPVSADRAEFRFEARGPSPRLTAPLYGPPQAIAAAFSKIGHLHYDGGHFLSALLPIDDKHAVPAAPLLIANALRATAEGFFVDEKKLPLDERGRLLVDMPHPTSFYLRTYSFGSALSTIRDGEALTVPKDAVVVMLPAMYTGNNDWAGSPFGDVPGGYVMTAVVNSVLRGSWLTPQTQPWIDVIFAGILGMLLGAVLTGWRFPIALVLVATTWLTGAVTLFTWLGHEIGWIFPMAAMTTSGMILFTDRAREAARAASKLRFALAGTLTTPQIENLVRSSFARKIEPTARTSTIVFFDIVGFSAAAERQSPAEAFLWARDILSEISRLVLDHGGFIDRTLGDGVLCLFGHPFGGASTEIDHACVAVRCALAVQREYAKRVERASGSVFLPLRVGVNTALVFIGDLGTRGRIDFTAIGAGVNFTQRLEAACEPSHLMIGRSTFDALTPDLQSAARRRWVKAKHVHGLIEAYDIDPFREDSAMRKTLERVARRQKRFLRSDERWPVPAEVALKVSCTLGEGTLLDFSRGGIGVELPIYLGIGVELDFTVEGIGTPIRARVRWSEPRGDQVLHGLSFVDLAPARGAAVVEALRAACGFRRAA